MPEFIRDSKECESLNDSVKQLVDNVLSEVIEIRRDFHKHPELAYEERRTSDIVARWLESNSIRVRKGVAGTGVVGLLEGTQGKSTVALRADMDALPLTETSEIHYASATPGIAHSCGHDGHTAILMGTAKVLHLIRDYLNSNVKFIFQPAEEKGKGAEKMCKEGVLENPSVDAIFALHAWPDLQAGEIGIKYGAMMAAADEFEIVIYGKGGHGAHPHRAIDPIVMAAKVIDLFQVIISRHVSPLTPAVITVGKIGGGSASNIIPDSVSLEGTIRTLDEQTRERIIESMKRTIESVAAMFQAPLPKFRILDGYPATINDKMSVEKIARVGKAALGSHNVKVIEEPSMGSEDFSYYLQKTRGAMFRLGVAFPGAEHIPLHNARFNFNDNSLRTGIIVMTNLVLEYDNNQSS